MCQHALITEQGSVKTGVKNALLRIYEGLNKSFEQAKSKKLNKKKQKAKRTPDLNNDDHILQTKEQEGKILLNSLVNEMNSQLKKANSSQ